MSETPRSDFSWIPIHHETATRLLDFRDRQRELIDLLQRMEAAGLRAVSVRDQVSEGVWGILTEIDPFSFFSNFNRNVTLSNRRELWAFLKEEWNLSAPVPGDFSGIPTANNQNAWFMSYAKRRVPEHVPTLWKFFQHVLGAVPATLDTNLMDECLGLRMVGMSKLTMGMFWVRPEVWVSADGKNVSLAKSRGIVTKPKDATTYRDWAARLVEKVGGDLLRFSHEAHIQATTKVALVREDGELGSPFDQFFGDLESASDVLDTFREAISLLSDSEDLHLPHKNLCTSFRYSTGGVFHSINLNFGTWALLRYQRDGRWMALLTEEFCAKRGWEIRHIFKSWRGKGSFCLALLDDEELRDPETREVMRSRLETIPELFEKWSNSPLLRFHQPELYQAIVDGNRRAGILTKGLDVENTEKARPVWVIAPGENAKHWESWRKDGIAALGWNATGDLVGLEGVEAFREAVANAYPDSGPANVGRMLHDFALEMKPGDLVVAKKGRGALLGWGTVTSEYRYDDGSGPDHHVRSVEWHESRAVNLPEGMTLPVKSLTAYADRSANRLFLDFLEATYEFDGADVESAESASTAYAVEHALTDLFMDAGNLDRMVSLLRRKKNLVLQGAPGTGKTFVAKRLAWLLMGQKDGSRVETAQFHQSTSYEDFIQGLRPDESGRFLLTNGVFYEFCRRAAEAPVDVPHVFIIDEINRGNLSKIFGELMMLIEHDKRGDDHGIRLVYGGPSATRFHVPENVHLIGTMNTADRSLSLVDYALRRRFAFFEMEPGFSSPTFATVLGKRGIQPGLIARICSTMGALNDLIAQDPGLGRGHRIGHSFFVPTRNVPDGTSWFSEIVHFEILPLIEEYWIDDEGRRKEAAALFT